MKTKTIKISQVKLDNEYYPRLKWSWQTSYDYSKSMEAGIEFPLIEVAIIDDSHYLVDGKHRLEAYKMLKEEFVTVLINEDIKDLKKLFVEAVKRNITHGRPFSVQEKADLCTKLQKFDMTKEEVSKLIGVPITNFNKFVSDRITNTLTGETISLKAVVKHKAGEVVDDNFDQLQQDFSTTSQYSIIIQMIDLLKNDLIDLTNKRTVTKLNELVSLIKTKTKGKRGRPKKK